MCFLDRKIQEKANTTISTLLQKIHTENLVDERVYKKSRSFTNVLYKNWKKRKYENLYPLATKS